MATPVFGAVAEPVAILFVRAYQLPTFVIGDGGRGSWLFRSGFLLRLRLWGLQFGPIDIFEGLLVFLFGFAMNIRPVVVYQFHPLVTLPFEVGLEAVWVQGDRRTTDHAVQDFLVGHRITVTIPAKKIRNHGFNVLTSLGFQK